MSAPFDGLFIGELGWETQGCGEELSCKFVLKS